MSAQNNLSVKSNVQSFFFEKKDVRVVIHNGEPWFVAKDVCDVLTISKYRDAISILDIDERGSVKVDTLGGVQELTAINESGLYTLIVRSNKPEAKKFRKWVTSEVIPTIRKTGRYVHPSAPPPGEVKEFLNADDMQNLQHLVHLITSPFHFQNAFAKSVWEDLRLVANNPAPQKWQVNHIPALTEELRRLFVLTNHLSDTIYRVEQAFIRKVIRKGANPEQFLDEARAQLIDAATKEVEELNTCIARWGQMSLDNFSERKPK